MFVQSWLAFLAEETFGSFGPTYYDTDIIPSNVCYAFFEWSLWTSFLLFCCLTCYLMLLYLRDRSKENNRF